MENNNNKLLGMSLVLGLAIIISASIGSFTFYQLRSNNTISSTGSSKRAVTSDTVKWTSNITRNIKTSTIKDGYVKMENDLKEVKNFLTANGIPQEEIEISPIFMYEIYDNNNQPEKNYNLVQNIEVKSSEVQKIKDLAQNTNSLITAKGLFFSTVSLEYYYSKLPELRVELLASAVEDSKQRANALASAGGKKIGAMRSASSGVVQVMSANSVEVSDYGMYDTSKIEKEVMVTVKASFDLK
jgi:uncharacterized protein